MRAIIKSCTGRTVTVLTGGTKEELEGSAEAICDGDYEYYYELMED